MLKSQKLRLLTVLSLLIITPLGFLSKEYSGPLKEWVNDYSGDILYEVFWCLFFFLFIPKRQAITTIPIGVFIVTCLIEFLQLWKNPSLDAFRATFLGKTLLGTTFVWWDFPHYALGCIIGWLWLRQLWRFRHMMSAKSTTIDVGAGLSNKLAWHTENSQSKPALRLGFIKVNQPDMISDGSFQVLSPNWEQALGWSTEALKSHNWTEFLHPDDVDSSHRCLCVLSQIDDTQNLSLENRFRTKDGSYRWL